MNEDNPYKVAYEREKTARIEAEQLLDDKSRELYLLNEELKASNQLLKDQQNLMLRNEKLATLGTLSAGVAHEINNPLAFVYSNIGSLNSYIESYRKLLSMGSSWLESGNLPEEQASNLQQLLDEEDLRYIDEDLHELIGDTRDGLERLRDIVENLRRFSHSNETEWHNVNITECLESTLKLLNNELKDRITVLKNFTEIPAIQGKTNELNQAFLNMIINACQAMQETSEPQLNIQTVQFKDQVVIRISDNGCGMSEEVQKAIFDPFFTTKKVGEGTGMGMSISYSIIKDHNGWIDVKSAPGEGSSFTIHLPVSHEEATEEAPATC